MSRGWIEVYTVDIFKKSSIIKDVFWFDCHPILGIGLMRKVGITLFRVIPPFYLYDNEQIPTAIKDRVSFPAEEWTRSFLLYKDNNQRKDG